MRVTFIAERGNPGENNTSVNLRGLSLSPAFSKFFTVDFEPSLEKVTGTVDNISITKDAVTVTGDVAESFLDHYPAIGFTWSQKTAAGAINIIDKGILFEIALCSSPNADPSIKTIREQLIDQANAVTTIPVEIEVPKIRSMIPLLIALAIGFISGMITTLYIYQSAK